MTSASSPVVSVIVPTHNPHPGRLGRTLAGLRAQTLDPGQWEIILVDNASAPPVNHDPLTVSAPSPFRLVPEPQLGLSHARRRGLSEAKGDIVVLVDDDNILAPDYLASVVALFNANSRIGLLGGRSMPEFEVPPAPWKREFDSLLALRDLGNEPMISHGLRGPHSRRNEYPAFAPIGAGMALRRAAGQAWLENSHESSISDRRGTELTSGGDNDIVLCAMQAGWEVGYFPTLQLTHLIPAGRLDPDYLARLNRGIQKSWMQVLSLHDANAWPLLSPGSAKLRQIKAWFSYHAWSSAAARIRWQGACGHFEGRITP